MRLNDLLVDYRLSEWWAEHETEINDYAWECIGSSSFSSFVEHLELDKNNLDIEESGDLFNLKLCYESEFSGVPDSQLDSAVDNAGGVTIVVKGSFNDSCYIEFSEVK